MKLAAFSSVIVILMFTACLCHADSLVITYRSGKTQTVVLDEPSQGINSWQFVSGSSTENTHVSPPVAEPARVQKEQSPQIKDDNHTEKAPAKKSDIRMNWNAKPIAD